MCAFIHGQARGLLRRRIKGKNIFLFTERPVPVQQCLRRGKLHRDCLLSFLYNRDNPEEKAGLFPFGMNSAGADLTTAMGALLTEQRP
jgi:hypothetical protein